MRIACAAALVGLTLAAGPAVASGSVPYYDDSVAGGMALCDSRGRAVTSGRLDAAPFAAKVVSSFVPPGASAGTGVFVLAFQPRQGVPPGEWSGEALTASSHYTDRRHPMAEVTYGDITLLQASQDYPPQWDGLLQLRVYAKNPDQPTYSAHYAALDVRIGKSTWQAVDPAPLSCSSGTATSDARLLAPSSVTSPAPSRRPVPSRSSAGPVPAFPSSRASAQPAATATSQASASSSHGSRAGMVVGLGVAALVAVATVLLWRRRRLG